MKLPTHFTKEDVEDIKQAILNAELDTSGEIRVHVENLCPDDNVMARAAYLFEKLKIHKTKQRNGILFYLAVESRQFAILGDSGIDAVIDADYWENLKDVAVDYFKNDKYADGLIDIIGKAGLELKKNFPYEIKDNNELPDDISLG
ncbi:TPM domain-containing protein [Bacteroidales bacterium OttesenSCG-928-K03]|nr:TPM domain-containing protein [Bacteroidales bacterium OttesenSCG-928-K22]MDL2242581.1 TPM domain-containing protein [Bacteroidales bacterium OttesenSCG-928-K03]